MDKFLLTFANQATLELTKSRNLPTPNLAKLPAVGAFGFALGRFGWGYLEGLNQFLSLPKRFCGLGMVLLFALFLRQPLAQCVECGLGAVVEVELLEDVAEPVAHGFLRE